MSVDKVCILILAESHMAFNWEIKWTFDSTQTDQPDLTLNLLLFKALHYFYLPPGLFCSCAQKGRFKVKAGLVWSVCLCTIESVLSSN